MHLNAFGRTEARRGDMRRTFDTRQGTKRVPNRPAHPRLLILNHSRTIVPVVDSVLGWFATAAPRNVGAAVVYL